MGRQVQMVAWLQTDRIGMSFEGQCGAPLQQDHPFVLVLVVPKTRRTALPCRNNSLHADRRILNQYFGEFASQVVGNALKQVARCFVAHWGRGVRVGVFRQWTSFIGLPLSYTGHSDCMAIRHAGVRPHRQPVFSQVIARE